MLAVAARLAWLEAERPRLIKGSLGFITTPTYQRILADKEADNAALRAEIARWQAAATTVVRQWDGEVADGSEIEDGIEELRKMLAATLPPTLASEPNDEGAE